MNIPSIPDLLITLNQRVDRLEDTQTKADIQSCIRDIEEAVDKIKYLRDEAGRLYDSLNQATY